MNAESSKHKTIQGYLWVLIAFLAVAAGAVTMRYDSVYRLLVLDRWTGELYVVSHPTIRSFKEPNPYEQFGESTGNAEHGGGQSKGAEIDHFADLCEPGRLDCDPMEEFFREFGEVEGEDEE